MYVHLYASVEWYPVGHGFCENRLQLALKLSWIRFPLWLYSVQEPLNNITVTVLHLIQVCCSHFYALAWYVNILSVLIVFPFCISYTFFIYYVSSEKMCTCLALKLCKWSIGDATVTYLLVCDIKNLVDITLLMFFL